MKIEIPELIAKAARLSELELRGLLAVKLYENGHISLGQGGQLAALSQDAFLDLLAQQGVVLHYDSNDLKEDMENLKDL